MSLLECFDCEERFATPESLQEHLWGDHISDCVNEDGKCPACSGSLCKANATYHYSCLFEVDESELGLFHDTNDRMCPLCEQPKPYEEIESHVLDHSSVAWLENLGSDRSCNVCGLALEETRNHWRCIHTAGEPDTGETGDPESCPAEDCEARASTRGLLLWHIWESHIDTREKTKICPGCEAQLEIGDLTKHLACVESFDNSVSKLLPSLDRTCFICGLTVYDSSVLHRHFYQKHFSQSGNCPGCGEKLTESEGAD